jgi:hypothetical protein
LNNPGKGRAINFCPPQNHLSKGHPVLSSLGLERYLPINPGYLLIGLFMIIVAIPAFVYSWQEMLAARKQ